jgi:hypothetical protein
MTITDGLLRMRIVKIHVGCVLAWSEHSTVIEVYDVTGGA